MDMADQRPRARRAVAIGLAAIGLLSLLPRPAAAQTVIPTYNAIDADTLKKIIAAQGQAQVTSETGDPQGPVIKVQLPSGLNYSILMDDCDGGQPNLCKSLEFRALLPAGTLN